MSKQLDYNNLSEEDKEWLRARGWGNRIPGEAQAPPPGVVLDPNATGEELLAATPNTGTATRPANMVVESVPGASDTYTPEDYASWKSADLEAEVNDRNKARGEDDQIQVQGSGKDGNVVKADLVGALVADDSAHATPAAEDQQQAPTQE